MTKLKELKQKIIEAVPEIMELSSFEIWVLKVATTFILKVDSGLARSKVTYADMKMLEDSLKKRKKVGRPITLEDILRAIECRPAQPRNILVSAGGFYEVNDEGHLELVGYWHLSKPLSEQSEETINFLHGILVK